MDDNLFHYTTFDAVKSIIENNQLRLNRIDKVRDNTEVCELKKILKRCIEDNNDNLSSIKLDGNSIIEDFLNQRNKSYIFCASLNYQNEYLWEHYACNGTGVCIEFDKNCFPCTSGRAGDANTLPNIFAKIKMIYGEDEFIYEFESWLKKFSSAHDCGDHNARRQFILALSYLADCYKDCKFKVENETRIVYFNEIIWPEIRNEFYCSNSIYVNSGHSQQYKIYREDSAHLNYRLYYDLGGSECGIHRSIASIHVKSIDSYDMIQRIFSKFSLNMEVNFIKD